MCPARAGAFDNRSPLDKAGGPRRRVDGKELTRKQRADETYPSKEISKGKELCEY